MKQDLPFAQEAVRFPTMIGQTLGHYLVLEEIGKGGMGVVYRAHDSRLDRDVAIKVLPPGTTKDAASRDHLRKEALALSRLSHPNIAHVYDFDTQEGIEFLVMEYIKGITLSRKLTEGPLPEESAINLGIQIASALENAAEVGIIHRDLKPGNAMITPKGIVKVLDFGLAKLFRSTDEALTQSLTHLSEGAGTLPYMAPEQLKGESTDFRADIYSLGALLYEAATGTRPFDSRVMTALVADILNKSPVSLRQLNPNLSPGYEHVVLRCLAKEPSRRYQTASELRAALESLQDNQGLALSDRVAKAFRGHKFLAVIAVCLATIVAGILASWHDPKKLPARRPSQLAVLPLVESQSDNATAAFGNGLVETLTTRLTQLSKNHSLEVVPASEVRAKGVKNLQEANQQFGATLGLQLNIERSGQFVRVNYALVDANEHRQLGGDTITAPASDPFTLEDRVADSIVKSLEIELQPKEHQVLTAHGTAQPAAYDYYLQGRGYLQDYQKRENIDSAITVFGHALERDPRYALAFAGLGETYWRRYELDKDNQWATKAQLSCEKAVALDFSQTESHVCLGMVYNGTGKYEAAATQYQRAVESEPTNDDAIRGLATAYASLGKLDDAEKTYKMAINTRPQYWRGYNSLGSLYVSQGRYREAAEMFSRVVGLAPDSFRGYSNLGATYIRMGQYRDAVKAIEGSIQIRPTADAYSNLGTAFFHLRQFDEAAHYYREATKLNDKDYVVWGNLGDAYYYSGKGRRVEASEAYEKATSLAKLKLEVNPHDSAVLGDIAAYNSMLNRRQESLAFLTKALREAGGDDPNLFFDAAMVHNQFGETKVALEWVEKALAAGYSASTAADTPALDNLHTNPQFQTLLRDRTVPKN